ncbi:MAG TPA: hypothetical protein VJM50_24790 [Pyrinomonadaceae bacterium]|nr:hypothetical protein [Pyrinomonadaceae bacterium]
MSFLWRVRTELTGPMITGGGQNDLYFAVTGGTAAQAVTAAGAFWQAVAAGLSSQLSWATQPEVIQIDDATGDISASVQTTPQSGIGSDVGEALPKATMGLIRWRTGNFVGGREIRGRTFVPGVIEADNTTNGVPSTTIINVMNNAAAGLLAAANADLVVYSPTKHTSALVTSASAWNQWAVLRSRRD